MVGLAAERRVMMLPMGDTYKLAYKPKQRDQAPVYIHVRWQEDA